MNSFLIKIAGNLSKKALIYYMNNKMIKAKLCSLLSLFIVSHIFLGKEEQK
jgi:hypothetical protein